MSKRNKTPLEIFAESIGLYFSNFDKFVKYMTFPVFGQIIGLGLVFLLSFYYAKTMPNIVETIPVLNNFLLLLGIAILIILPGFIIFLKAFWEYLIAYGAVNSMLENLLKSGRVYDFDAHTELIKRRSLSFVGLWILFGLFSLVSIILYNFGIKVSNEDIVQIMDVRSEGDLILAILMILSMLIVFYSIIKQSPFRDFVYSLSRHYCDGFFHILSKHLIYFL